MGRISIAKLIELLISSCLLSVLPAVDLELHTPWPENGCDVLHAQIRSQTDGIQLVELLNTALVRSSFSENVAVHFLKSSGR